MRKNEKHCWICGESFEPKTAWQRYCSRKCHTENYRNAKGRVIDKGRHCRQCGKKFLPPRKGGANQQHCSLECAIKSARESRCNFYKKKPHKLREYQNTWRSKVGPDNNTTKDKVWILYPTCHALFVLDRKHYTPEQLNLKGGG